MNKICCVKYVYTSLLGTIYILNILVNKISIVMVRNSKTCIIWELKSMNNTDRSTASTSYYQHAIFKEITKGYTVEPGSKHASTISKIINVSLVRQSESEQINPNSNRKPDKSIKSN